MWRAVHINHTKPAKFTAPDLPKPVPAPETPHPSFGYLPSGLLGPRPPPPASAAPAEGSSSSPTAAIPAQPPAAPAASEMQPPATTPANQQPASAFHPRRSPRLNSEPGWVCAIKGPPGNLSPQSEKSATMARTYPLTVPYNQCLGVRTDRLSFSSLYFFLYQPFIAHCCAKAFPLCFHHDLSSAILLHDTFPSSLSMSSLHLVLGLPLPLPPYHGLHSVVLLVHLSVSCLHTWPAHLHLLFLTVKIISLIFVLSLI